jgi:type IV pilus modification protein PilV
MSLHVHLQRRAVVAAGRPAPGASGGFSLIEILVAVLIISVGVLGVAGLQLVSLQNNTSAMYRTQAFQAAYEIIDRARANPDEDYSIALADPVPAAPPDCEAADCTPADMRTYDIATWLTALDGPPTGLPGGDGAVVVAGDTMTVTVQWRDDRDPAAQPFSVDVTTSF